MQIVWFKRDLRVDDHAPLREAARRGPVLPLYVIEPPLLVLQDADPRHWGIAHESLVALRESLAALGQPLVVRVGDPVTVLEELCEGRPTVGLWSHQETGNLASYARDRRVGAWARTRGIAWTQLPQDGVVRRLADRDEWEQRWEVAMNPTPLPPPDALLPLPGVDPGPIPTAADLGLGPDLVERQRGGEPRAIAALDGFLARRGEHYTRAMSSPLTATRACSRLSPHLALGAISTRRTYHRARARLALAYEAGETSWAGSMRSFISRLHWRGHFMQKLESEPAIEEHPQHPAYEDFWPPHPDPAFYGAWAAGETGYPLVDATMRALVSSGYLNFRMRAMLTSFACHDLRIHWRVAGLQMARMYLDYEPGIHWPQMQMQAAVTGINAPRIYDPTKAARELDPTGAYIRRWIPALEGVPDSYIHMPWLMSGTLQERAGCRIGQQYPAPIVDHAEVARAERARIAALMRDPDFAAQAGRVLRTHGSRRRTRRVHAGGPAKARPQSSQLRLPFAPGEG